MVKLANALWLKSTIFFLTPEYVEQVRVNKVGTAVNFPDRENHNKGAVSSSSTQSSEIPNM